MYNWSLNNIVYLHNWGTKIFRICKGEMVKGLERE